MVEKMSKISYTKIKLVLKVFNINQIELAKRMGVSKTYINKFLKGKVVFPLKKQIVLLEALEDLIKQKRLDTGFFR